MAIYWGEGDGQVFEVMSGQILIFQMVYTSMRSIRNYIFFMGLTNVLVEYSQICIKRPPLGQRKGDRLKDVLIHINFL